MSAEIQQGKRKLPLPALMHRLGLREHAKKSAHCPFHNDKHNSFSVWKNGAGLWFWKCHAGCGEGDEITFLELHEHISNSEATKLFLEMAGPNGATLSAQKVHMSEATRRSKHPWTGTLAGKR
jgi:DNA primase